MPDTAAAAVLSSKTAAITSQVLLAANSARKGATIYNDSSATLYLALAATASTTSYSEQVAPGTVWRMPVPPVYVGPIAGLWASAVGAARISEL